MRDRVDVGRLACLLAAGLVPEVWVPPVEARELRSLLAHLRRLAKTQATMGNRLHSTVRRYNLTLPKGEVFLHENCSWWLGLDISRTENLRTR